MNTIRIQKLTSLIKIVLEIGVEENNKRHIKCKKMIKNSTKNMQHSQIPQTNPAVVITWHYEMLYINTSIIILRNESYHAKSSKPHRYRCHPLFNLAKKPLAICKIHKL